MGPFSDITVWAYGQALHMNTYMILGSFDNLNSFPYKRNFATLS